MKSSNKQYYQGLDHIRALAAYIVFCWHFLHTTTGNPIPFDYDAKMPFLSILNEGHVGVSIFMVLSGYLFAKILAGKKINYPMFYVNRFLRLAPLMCFVVLVNAAMLFNDFSSGAWFFFASLANGLVFPYLPNAGWSITVEFHFYLLLPFLLWISRDSINKLLILLSLVILFRYLIFLNEGSVQYLAYWTILGRIDLFIIGLIGFHLSDKILSSNKPAVLSLIFIGAGYYLFDVFGGFKGTSESVVWVLLSTFEGLSIVSLIVHYDRFSTKHVGRFSNFVAKIGTYSYSIYLLHSFIVFRAASYIHNEIVDLSNFYVALLAGTFVFICFIPVAYLSYRFIEKPFLTHRVRYIDD